MDGLPEMLEQGRRFAEQHVPPESLPPPVPVALMVLLAGIVIGVLGAKLARPALTAAFGIGGAVAAGELARAFELPLAFTVIIGALLIGVIGFCLHRLWVGLATSFVLVAVVLSIFGYYRILPEAVTFNQTYPAVVSGAADAEFALPDAEQRAEYNRRSPQKWARDFWAHLTHRQADVEERIAVIGAAAALAGLLLGVLATRLAWVACSALVGTSLVASGAMALAATLVPDHYRAALDNPRWLVAAGVGLLLCSLLLQALLNRRSPPRPTTVPAR